MKKGVKSMKVCVCQWPEGFRLLKHHIFPLRTPAGVIDRAENTLKRRCTRSCAFSIAFRAPADSTGGTDHTCVLLSIMPT